MSIQVFVVNMKVWQYESLLQLSTLGMMHSGGSCKVEASAKSQQSNLVSVNVCQQKLLKGLWADILRLRWAQCH